ncbi:MAG: hypothetical protein O7F69_09790 [Alphaproteobacteria bacterium]|nr:hypothetical protein [Alphaproteobacteria bacterium]
MGSIFDLCRRIVALQNGRVIANGPPQAVRGDPAVQQASLGTRSAGHPS